MVKQLLSIWACLIFFGVGQAFARQQDAQEQLVGRWQADGAKTKEFYQANSLDAPDEQFLKQAADLSVEFTADHSVVVRAGESERMSGKWNFVKDEDGQLLIHLVRDGEETPATIEFLDPDTLAITPQTEKPLVLSRAVKRAMNGVVAKLIGAWKCDKDATRDLPSNKTFSQEQLDDMMAEAGGMVVRFEQDGSFSATTINEGEIRELKGTWKSNSVDEGKRTFQLALEAERGPDSLEVEMRDDGSVRFSPPDQPSAIFLRSNENADKIP